MTRVANKFSDPGGPLADYQWEINHNEEEQSGKTRNIEESANTAGTGLVKQQGDDGPLRFEYSGSILRETQLTTMLKYFQACKTRTVIFTDFAGDQYEVLVTSFQPTRKRTLRNPRDQANAPLHYWTYKIALEVITILVGPYADAGITP